MVLNPQSESGVAESAVVVVLWPLPMAVFFCVFGCSFFGDFRPSRALCV
jgi:hypothetical protein